MVTAPLTLRQASVLIFSAEWAFAQLRSASQARREKIVEQRIADKFDGGSVSSTSTSDSPIFSANEGETSATDLSDSDDDEFCDFAEAETNTAGDTVLPSPPLKDHEILSHFSCTLTSPSEIGTKGNLLVTPGKLKFVKPARKRDLNGRVVWQYDWSEIREMAKTMKKGVKEVVAKKQYEREGLELVFMDGVKVELEGFRGKKGAVGEGRREEAFCEVLGASGVRWQWKA